LPHRVTINLSNASTTEEQLGQLEILGNAMIDISSPRETDEELNESSAAELSQTDSLRGRQYRRNWEEVDGNIHEGGGRAL
jgi:glutamyl-tRNA reductase